MLEEGVSFTTGSVAKPSAYSPSRNSIPGEIRAKALLFDLDQIGISNITRNQPERLSILLPSQNGKAIEILLVKNEIFVPSFIAVDQNGAPIQLSGAYYKGMVKDIPSSLVALNVHENEISGFVSFEDLDYTFGKLEGLEEHIMYETKDLLSDTPFTCYTPDDDYVYTEEELAPHSFRSTNCTGIYVEVDFDITQGQGGLTEAGNYVTDVFNQSATLYAGDAIPIQLSEMIVWGEPDPYTSTSSSGLLSQFQSYRTSFNGVLGHLVGYAGGGGIAAGFNGLCNSNRSQSQCYSGIDPTFENVPTWSWTVSVFTHEMGHLFGSRHTHACVWDVPGRRPGALDGCYNTEGGCKRPGIPEDGGTIMSYCHLTSVGINFNKRFHDQPRSLIQNNVDGASCLGGPCAGSQPTCTDGIKNGNETGVDCGGPDCDPCPAPTCTDGIKNGNETGVDCGGPDCDPCPTCDEPENLFASKIKRTRAKLNWDAMVVAVDYTVRLRTASPPGTWSQTTTSSTNINATGLSNGVEYEWEVMTNCSGSSSPFAGPCFFIAGNSSSGGCASGPSAFIRNEETKVTVYPNPSSDILNVEFNVVPEGAIIQILNVVGKVVYESDGSVASPINEVNVSNWSSGLYLLLISDASGVVTTTDKIIIE